MKKKTIVVLEVEYDYDERKTTQEFAEQDAVSLVVQPNFNSVQNGTGLVSVEDLTGTCISQDVASKILRRDGFFYITSVHRDDLEERGFDVSEVTDSDMRYLSRLMGKDYCSQLFHESMEILAEMMGIPKREEGNIRRCDHCGKPMKEGYYLGGELACSDECCLALYSGDKNQMEEDLSHALEDDGDCYWTEWESIYYDD